MSVQEMIKWFFSNYEDPANGVLYDSREGGYQYDLGGPYDPREELYDQFRDADHKDIEEAAQKIYDKGYEWVKKGQY